MNLPAKPKKPGHRTGPKIAAPGDRIRGLWAIIAIDEDGDEALVIRRGAPAPWSNVDRGDWAPMVTADYRATELMLAMARDELLPMMPGLRLEIRYFEVGEIGTVLTARSTIALGGLNAR